MTLLPDPFKLIAAECNSPAILRLRMLELSFGMRGRELSREARRHAEAAIAQLQTAIVTRPGLSLADVAAKLRTLGDMAGEAAPSRADTAILCPGEMAEWSACDGQ